MGRTKGKKIRKLPPNTFWVTFLDRASSFFMEVLKSVKEDRTLAILWGFGILFLIILIVTLILASLPSSMKFGVVVLIVLVLRSLFVYTVPRMSLNGKKPHPTVKAPFIDPDITEINKAEFVLRADLCGELLKKYEKPKSSDVVLHGLDGFGKTTLAAALCQNLYNHGKIRKRFDGGILWAELDGDENMLSRLNYLYNKLPGKDHKLGKDHKFQDIMEAKYKLYEGLGDKNWLMVIDGVQDYETLKLFLDWGENCSRLITLSDFDIVTNMKNVDAVEVNEMSLNEAIQMLTIRLKDKPHNEKPFREMAEYLGGMPLMLEMTGSHLWAHTYLDEMTPDEAIADIKNTYDEKGVLALCRSKDKEKAFEQIMENSLNILDQVKRDHYIELAIFPEAIDVPLSVVGILWELNNSDTKELCEDLRNLSLIKLNLKAKTICLNKILRSFLENKVSDSISLHKKVARELFITWNMKDQKIKYDPNVEYALKYVFWHSMKAHCWDNLKKLLTDIEYLKAKQDRAEKYNFEKDFKALLNLKDQETQADTLVDILEGCLNFISKKLGNEKEKAEWLDILSHWINTSGDKGNQERWAVLKEVARKFDQACAPVSKELAKSYLKEGKNDWALRFAELQTWVYQRAEDYSKCIEACEFAEEMCLQEGMHIAYRLLARAEFIRMRARSLSKLFRPEDASEAYANLNRVFAQEQEKDWKLTEKDWKQLEEYESEELLHVPPMSDINGKKFSNVKVISNAHDSISALYIILFFREHGSTAEWIHPERFRTGELDSQGARCVILIGGPNAPGMFNLEDMFYEDYKEDFLKFYSSKELVDSILKIEQGNTLWYWVAGTSKVNTLMAAYKLTQDKEILNRIKISK